MLRYYLLSTLLVVGLLVVGAHFSQSGKPVDVSGGPASHKTPSPPRVQATQSFPPAGVHGEAPWAFSALPECFVQQFEAHGPASFVLSHVPREMRRVPAPNEFASANCRVEVLAHTGVVTRGTERLVVPPETHFYASAREFAFVRVSGKTAELRVYGLAGGAPIEFQAAY